MEFCKPAAAWTAKEKIHSLLLSQTRRFRSRRTLKPSPPSAQLELLIQQGCRKWEELPAHQREADLGLQATAQAIGQLVCNRDQWPGALQTVVAATEAAREIRLGGGSYPTAQLGLLLAWILSPWITRKMCFSRCGSGGRETGGRGRDLRLQASGGWGTWVRA